MSISVLLDRVYGITGYAEIREHSVGVALHALLEKPMVDGILCKNYLYGLHRLFICFIILPYVPNYNFHLQV